MALPIISLKHRRLINLEGFVLASGSAWHRAESNRRLQN